MSEDLVERIAKALVAEACQRQGYIVPWDEQPDFGKENARCAAKAVLVILEEEWEERKDALEEAHHYEMLNYMERD